ncbi:MAG: hypothetical protein AABW48_04970 [Nanoarchaeota archaeon]
MKPIIILSILLFLLAVSVSAEVYHYYKIDLKYNNGVLSYNKISVEVSSTKLQMPEGMYVAEVVSFNNEILNLTFFAFPLTIFYDAVDLETGEINDGGMIELNETEVTLYVPYYINAKEINIYDQNLIKKLFIDISPFAKETAVEELKEIKEEIKKEEIIEKETVLSETSPLFKIIEGVVIGIAIIIALILIIVILKKKKPSKHF